MGIKSVFENEPNAELIYQTLSGLLRDQEGVQLAVTVSLRERSNTKQDT